MLQNPYSVYKTTRHKEQNDTHIFVTYILNTLRRFTVCYCCEKRYEKYRGLKWCENGLRVRYI